MKSALKTLTYKLTALAAALLDTPTDEMRRHDWMRELDDLYAQNNQNHSVVDVQRTAWTAVLNDLVNWQQRTSTYRAAMRNIAIRIIYTLVMLVWAVLAGLELGRGNVETVAWLVIASVGSPFIYSTWASDFRLLREVFVDKMLTLRWMVLALLAAVILLVVGSSYSRILVAVILLGLAHSLWGERLQELWDKWRFSRN